MLYVAVSPTYLSFTLLIMPKPNVIISTWHFFTSIDVKFVGGWSKGGETLEKWTKKKLSVGENVVSF